VPAGGPAVTGVGAALTGRVAALMRAGGWQRVTITASMGRLGTDVVGVGADGRRWLLRCHPDPARLDPADVHRFARTARDLRRGEVTMLVLAGSAPPGVLAAATRAGVTVVDADSLAWWTAMQARP
jgi:Restriction endonuclease